MTELQQLRAEVKELEARGQVILPMLKSLFLNAQYDLKTEKWDHNATITIGGLVLHEHLGECSRYCVMAGKVCLLLHQHDKVLSARPGKWLDEAERLLPEWEAEKERREVKRLREQLRRVD